MDRTHFLGLPYLQAAQAQKHVTHNEALRLIDACVQVAVESRSGPAAPPPAPQEGERHIVPAAASGAWAGEDGAVASFLDGAWQFVQPVAGWLVWVRDEERLVVHDGTAFVPAHGLRLDGLEHLGINATADTMNRLTVAGAGSLFTHDGAGHQAAINKAAEADTASVLFQTGYSGRAEMGLSGDDDLHVKTSTDGATWHEALVLSREDGAARLPEGLRLGAGDSLLQHYEEGVWTPELVGANVAGTPTYSANAGTFVRIGALVFVTARLAWASLGGLSGTAVIAGLPYPCRSGIANRAPMTTAWYNSVSMGADTTMLGGFVEPGETNIRLWGAYQAYEGTNLFLNEVHLTETGEIYLGCSYIAD
jgi:hypothetical protein